MKLPRTFTSERLFFEQAKESDLADIHNNWASDPEATKYMSWPRSIEVNDKVPYMRHSIAAAAEGKEYFIVIRETENGEAIGSTGANFYTPYKVETGYIFGKKYWGKGYATETTLAICRELKKITEVKRIQAGVHPDNKKSCRVLEKSGFSLEGRLRRVGVYPNISPQPMDSLMFSLIVE